MFRFRILNCEVVLWLGIIHLISYGASYRIGENPFHRGAFLDSPRDRYHLEWMVSLETGRITFNVTVQTRGWVLFGLANNAEESTGRDVVIGGVGQDGQPYFSDRHTGRYNDKLEEDSLQDYILESSSEAGAYTFLSFSRDLDTCDHQDYPITENKVTLIWAYGEEDSIDGYAGQGSRGGDQGSFDIYLLDPEYSPRVTRYNLFDQRPRFSGRDAATTQVWAITRTTQVPQNDTFYSCQIFKAPTLPRKHHVIGFELTFPDEESRIHTHHVIVHKCRAPRGSTPRSLFENYARSGQQQSCASVNRPASGGDMPTHFCQQIYMVWALGGREFFTPDHVGFPFGEDPDEYYLVQAHYDNPNRRSDITVKIDMTFFYTRRLRPNDGGVMLLSGHTVPGMPESILMPPQTPNSRKFGHCPGECTRRMFPREGITLVGGFLHSHTSGKQLRLHHFRRNEELPWILYDDNYSNNFQQVRALPRGEVQILPGDQVTMDCTFDTTWTNATVTGGLRTTQEMCLAYVVYYNLQVDYSVCASDIFSPSYRQRFLGVSNITWYESEIDWVAIPLSPRHLVGRTITDISDNVVEWDAATRRELGQLQSQHEHVARCGRDLHARDPAQAQQIVETAQAFYRQNGGGLVISGNMMTDVSTEDDYNGPASYPGGTIPYSIPETTCLHRGILNRGK